MLKRSLALRNLWLDYVPYWGHCRWRLNAQHYTATPLTAPAVAVVGQLHLPPSWAQAAILTQIEAEKFWPLSFFLFHTI